MITNWCWIAAGRVSKFFASRELAEADARRRGFHTFDLVEVPR